MERESGDAVTQCLKPRVRLGITGAFWAMVSSLMQREKSEIRYKTYMHFRLDTLTDDQVAYLKRKANRAFESHL